MTEKKRTAPRKSTTKKKVKSPKTKKVEPVTDQTPLTPDDLEMMPAPVFQFGPGEPTPEEKLENTRATCLQWSLTHYHTTSVEVDRVIETADLFVTYITTGQQPQKEKANPTRKRAQKVTPIKKKGN